MQMTNTTLLNGVTLYLEKRGGYDAHQITPFNNVVFVICIWKGGYSLKQKLIPANNVAFVLCIWGKGGDKGQI
jgi:hypothetical protein